MVNGYVNLPKEISEVVIAIGDLSERTTSIQDFELTKKFIEICKLNKILVLKAYAESTSASVRIDAIRFGVPSISYSSAGVAQYLAIIFCEQKMVLLRSSEGSGTILVTAHSY